jgi:virginiamycin B lyase
MRHGLRLLPVTLGVSVVMAMGAASAQAYIYWAIGGPQGSGGTTIARAATDGSGINRGFATGASNPAGLVVSGNYIYWANDATSSIGRANLNGSDPDPTWIPNLTRSAAGIAIDGSYIYWTDGVQYIGRATIGGTGVDQTFINVGTGTTPFGIAVQSGKIYVGTENQIRTVPATGGTISPLGPSLGQELSETALAIAGGYVYFGEFGTGNDANMVDGIGRMQLDGAGETGSYITGLQIPGGLASDGTYLYWSDSTAGEIGRALIGSEGATNIDYDFISEPDDPFGVAVDAGIDPTTTSISCTPTTLSIGQASACTATIADSASSSVPTGTVNFTGNGAFFSGSPCQLTPKAGGGASCTVGADLTSTGTQSIMASYSGDAVHQPSNASASLCAGTATQCGGKPPPPPEKPKCIVPKLKGKTLTQARTLLSKAHCALGKVKKPKAKKHHQRPALIVGSSKPRAGSRLAHGAKVAVTLVPARRVRRDRDRRATDSLASAA